jgi:hypothetical protein
MNTKPSNKVRASALHISLRVTLIWLCTTLLAYATMRSPGQLDHKPAVITASVKNARHCAVSKPNDLSKRQDASKSPRVEISASRQRVGGHEIAGFSARQPRTAQENLTPPLGLKPVEQEAWLAMAHRQEASGGMGFASFYPARYGEPFVVESGRVRVFLFVLTRNAGIAQKLPPPQKS